VEQEFLEKIERREFVRMEIPLNANISIVDQEKVLKKDISKDGVICNLSMTGACLELDPPAKSPMNTGYDSLFEFKNKMKLKIELFDESKTVEVIAESHWYHIKSQKGKRRLYVGVSFLGMTKSDQSSLGFFLASIENGTFFMKNMGEHSLTA